MQNPKKTKKKLYLVNLPTEISRVLNFTCRFFSIKLILSFVFTVLQKNKIKFFDIEVELENDDAIFNRYEKIR